MHLLIATSTASSALVCSAVVRKTQAFRVTAAPMGQKIARRNAPLFKRQYSTYCMLQMKRWPCTAKPQGTLILLLFMCAGKIQVMPTRAIEHTEHMLMCHASCMAHALVAACNLHAVFIMNSMQKQATCRLKAAAFMPCKMGP